ncbi:MAG: hypothetical protein GY822_08760 [Deltaproteobacteria bacterium]|nr:hypothetical protein [Deltaproteobacteria bacterium]
MTLENDPGQDAVRDPTAAISRRLAVSQAFSKLSQANRGLQSGLPVAATDFLDAYRTLAPATHAGFRAPLSLAFLAQVAALGGLPLVQQAHFILAAGSERSYPTITAIHGAALLEAAPSCERLSDGLALFLGVAHEAEKLQKILGNVPFDALQTPAALLGMSSEVLANTFGDEVTALRFLNGLLFHGANRSLHALHFDDAEAETDQAATLPDFSTVEGPLFVVAGATERIHDVLSPFVRKLRGELSQLADSQEEDALYDVLPLLYSDEKQAFSERLVAEAPRGFTPIPGGVVVHFERLSPQEVDRRAHGFVSTLKQKKAVLVVIGRHPQRLADVLNTVGQKTRALILLSEGLSAEESVVYPESIFDVVTGQYAELKNALLKEEERTTRIFSEVYSTPSLGLSISTPTTSRSIDSISSRLLQAAFQSRIDGNLERSARIGLGLSPLHLPHTHSDLALHVLARMAKAPTQATRHRSPKSASGVVPKRA